MTTKKAVFEDEPEDRGGVALPDGTKSAEEQSLQAVKEFIDTVPTPVITEASQVALIAANQKRADEGIKFINNLFKPSTDAVKKEKDTAENKRKLLVGIIERITMPLSQYRDNCVKAIRGWNLAEEKRLRDEAAKEKADADKKAAKLEKKGDAKGAEIARSFAPDPGTVKYTPPVELDGRTYGKKYKARVVNLYALCNAVAERQVLADAVSANMTFLNNEAKNHKGQNPPPGIEFFEE